MITGHNNSDSIYNHEAACLTRHYRSFPQGSPDLILKSLPQGIQPYPKIVFFRKKREEGNAKKKKKKSRWWKRPGGLLLKCPQKFSEALQCDLSESVSVVKNRGDGGGGGIVGISGNIYWY